MRYRQSWSACARRWRSNAGVSTGILREAYRGARVCVSCRRSKLKRSGFISRNSPMHERSMPENEQLAQTQQQLFQLSRTSSSPAYGQPVATAGFGGGQGGGGGGSAGSAAILAAAAAASRQLRGAGDAFAAQMRSLNEGNVTQLPMNEQTRTVGVKDGASSFGNSKRRLRLNSSLSMWRPRRGSGLVRQRWRPNGKSRKRMRRFRSEHCDSLRKHSGHSRSADASRRFSKTTPRTGETRNRRSTRIHSGDAGETGSGCDARTTCG